MTDEIKKPKLVDLRIDIGNGRVVVKKDGTIELKDYGDNLTLDEMVYILEEAKEFIKRVRKVELSQTELEKKDCEEKPIILEKTLDLKWEDSNFEGAEEFGEALFNVFNECMYVDNIPYTVTMLRNIKSGSKIKCVIRLEVSEE